MHPWSTYGVTLSLFCSMHSPTRTMWQVQKGHNYNTTSRINMEQFVIFGVITVENSHDTELLQAIVDYINVTTMIQTVKVLAARHRWRKVKRPRKIWSWPYLQRGLAVFKAVSVLALDGTCLYILTKLCAYILTKCITNYHFCYYIEK